MVDEASVVVDAVVVAAVVVDVVVVAAVAVDALEVVVLEVVVVSVGSPDEDVVTCRVTDTESGQVGQGEYETVNSQSPTTC
jgi:hypothetical protein